MPSVAIALHISESIGRRKTCFTWVGHSPETVTDGYVKIKGDLDYRKAEVEKNESSSYCATPAVGGSACPTFWHCVSANIRRESSAFAAKVTSLKTVANG